MRTVPVPTVSGFTVSLKVTTTLLPTATFAAALAGTTELTFGTVLSGTAELPVLNVLLNGVTWFPARSVKPLAPPVYAVLTANGAAGVNVITDPLALTVPVTGVLPAVNVRPLLPTLTTLTGALTWTCTLAFTGTPAALFGGVTEMIVGAVVCVPAPVVNVL